MTERGVTAPRIVVAGWGNPLRGDDGAGWRVAEAVEERWGDRVQVLQGQQPLPEWSAALADADVAYLVDACVDATCSEGPAVRGLQAPEATWTAGASLLGGHALGADELVQLARSLFGHAPETYLLSIPASQLDLGDDVSPCAQAGIEAALRYLEKALTERLG